MANFYGGFTLGGGAPNPLVAALAYEDPIVVTNAVAKLFTLTPTFVVDSEFTLNTPTGPVRAFMITSVNDGAVNMLAGSNVTLTGDPWAAVDGVEHALFCYWDGDTLFTEVRIVQRDILVQLLDPERKSTLWTISADGLTFTATNAGGNWETGMARLPKSSGKWYWEVTQSYGGTGDIINGVVRDTYTDFTDLFGDTGDGWGYDNQGSKFHSGGAAYGATLATNDIVGVALDMDLGAIWFSKNGTWQGGATQGEIEAGNTTNAAFTNLGGETVVPANSMFILGDVAEYNFGATAFNTAPPAGFLPITGSPP